MPIDLANTKSGKSYGDKSETTTAPETKTGEETQKAASGNSDPKESLLRAQQNALEAKEAALGAINRFYKESKASETRAEKLLSELEDSLQRALSTASKSVIKESSRRLERSAALSPDKDNPTISKRVLDTGPKPLGVISDLKHSILNPGHAETEEVVKEEFFRLVMRASPQLRRLIDALTRDKAQVITEKIIAEARAEIVVAREAVNKAHLEVNATKEEAKRAYHEAENARKSAEAIVNQVKRDAMKQVADEVSQAHEEVQAAKAAAAAAIKRSEEEIKKNCEEVARLDRNAQVTLTLAREKIQKEAEALKATKLQSEVNIRRAKEEVKEARAEAEAIRRKADEALEKAASQSQQAKAEMEVAKQTLRDATITAEKQAYEKFVEEIKKMKEEVALTSKTAYDAISKAKGENQQAQEELEILKKSSEEVINKLQQELSDAKRKAEKAKRVMSDIVSKSREEKRKVNEQAESSVAKANEAIIKAKKDIIEITRDEIIKARQALETPHKDERAAGMTDRESASDNSNSEYIATVLHEMRTPLHSIAGFAKLMKEDDVTDDATRQEFLSIMVQQSESLSKLIDDLSHVLNNRGVALPPNREMVSSYMMINEAIDGVQTLAQQKKNLISHNLTPELPEVEADASRIKQVITNLLTNAIKFSPEDSPIFVKAQARDDELLVQVIDYGIGIPNDELSDIFDKSYRAQNHGDVEGEGLGLYICRHIINVHGGNIWAESVENEGSTFCFTLPLIASGEQENKSTEKDYAG